ncbi:MAG: ATP synthase F1 subunit delta [Oscillospiraceae bacterium]|nr:ATP synthase F1 subunit delta [Oscillospiraceae bacterium]
MAETAQKIYARSLFEVAKEADKLDGIFAGLADVSAAFAENPDYIRLLSSPAISKAERVAAVGAVFDGKTDPHLSNFLKVLAQNGRIPLLGEIKAEFDGMYHAENNLLAVTAVTAIALTPELRKKLCKKLETITGKQIRLTERVDSSVLGGVLLQYDNKEIDGTVRERLGALRRQLGGTVI